MGNLLHILAALASIAVVDFGFESASSFGIAVPLLVIVPAVLGRGAKEFFLRGRFRAAERCERLLGLSPLLMQAIAVFGLGWCGWLRERFGIEVSMEGWPGPELFLGLAPFVVGQVAAIDSRARLQDSRSDEIASLRSFQLRMFLSALLPLIFFVSVSTAIRSNEWVMVHVEEVELINGALTVVLLGLLVMAMPWILSRAWDTEPLPVGMQRDLLEGIAKAAGFRCKELLVWKTANQMANAAIVGFSPGSRRVLFTDALLTHLQPLELAGVFAHEMGHARRHHAFLFSAYAIAVFLGLDLLLRQVEVESEWVFGTVLAGLVVAWYVSFGFLSRRFELEADLESLDVVRNPVALVSALHAVVGPGSRGKHSWRHFSTDKRTAFLLGLAMDPTPAVRLRRQLRIWRVVILAAFLLAVGFQLASMLGSWKDDRAWAMLRLGYYAEAPEYAAGTEDERLDALCVLVDSLPQEELSFEAFLLSAQGALAAGEGDAAADFLRLALLRRPDDAARVVLIWLGEGGAAPTGLGADWDRALLGFQ